MIQHQKNQNAVIISIVAFYIDGGAAAWTAA